MIITDWSDASLTIANDDGNVAAERASAAACTRALSEADKRRHFTGRACLAIYSLISKSYDCVKWLAAFSSECGVWRAKFG
jgi:hypothetical protein